MSTINNARPSGGLPEKELLATLQNELSSGEIQFVSAENDARYSDQLSEVFPFCGSKIRWSVVPNHKSEEIGADAHKSAHQFLEEIVGLLNMNEDTPLIVMGDFALTVMLAMPLKVLRLHLNNIIDLPQHTYIIPHDMSWCLCYSMEGYMDFGCRPK